jgi:hypothetical protein
MRQPLTDCPRCSVQYGNVEWNFWRSIELLREPTQVNEEEINSAYKKYNSLFDEWIKATEQI